MLNRYLDYALRAKRTKVHWTVCLGLLAMLDMTDFLVSHFFAVNV